MKRTLPLSGKMSSTSRYRTRRYRSSISFLFHVVIVIACGWTAAPASGASVVDSTKPSDFAVGAGAPIPVSANSYTWKDYNKQHLEWCTRHVLTPFQEVAKDRSWEKDAVKFVREVLPLWLHPWKKPPSSLCEQGQKLLRNGCDDPLICYFTYWLERNSYDRPPRRHYREYEDALRRIEQDTRFPRAVVCFVAVELGNLLAIDASEARRAKLKAVDQRILALIRQSLEEGSYDRDNDILFVQHALYFYTNRRLHRLNDELADLYANSEKLPVWVKHTLLGHIEVARAWKERGSGWAREVTKQRWAGFAVHMSKARAELLAGWKSRPDRPEAASEMIAVVMAGHGPPGDSLRLWFDRAVKAQFDYMPAYNRLVWALQPRWRGNLDVMFAFGRACLATHRYDTRVPDFFFEVIHNATFDLEDNRKLYRLPLVAADVMALDQTLLAAPERKDEVQDRLSFIVFHGWLCERYAEARKALDQLNGKPSSCIKSQLSNYGIAETAVLADIYIYTSEAKDDYAQGNKSLRAEEYTEAVKYLQAALQKLKGPDVAFKVLRIGLNIAMWSEQVGKGGWVNVSPKPGNLDEGWTQHYGKWEALEGGVLQIRSNNEQVLAAAQVRVGTDYEVRADVEIDAPTDIGQAIGVVLGYTRLGERDWLMCEVWKDDDTKESQATLFRRFYPVNNPKFPAPLEKKNHLHVQCWKNQVTFYLNGKRVFADMVSREGTTTGLNGKFGFGAHALFWKNTTRISNIEVRLLKEPPKPPE